MPDAPVRTALVTGSNRGIGLEFVRQLHTRVDRLFATCRRPDEADALQSLAAQDPDTVHVFGLDVADADSIDAAVQTVGADVDTLDLLLNNAGVSGSGSSDRFDDVDFETLMHVFRINAAAPHVMARRFMPLLSRSSGLGRLVNITSQLGSIENAHRGGWHSYRASKAALNMLTRMQSFELSPENVVAIAMHPGWVQTDMGGSNARLTPEDAVSGMLDVIFNLTPDDAGRFFSHDGSELPW